MVNNEWARFNTQAQTQTKPQARESGTLTRPKEGPRSPYPRRHA